MSNKVHTDYLGVRLCCSDFVDFAKQIKAHFHHPYDNEWAKNETDRSIITAKEAINNMLSLKELTNYWRTINSGKKD